MSEPNTDTADKLAALKAKQKPAAQEEAKPTPRQLDPSEKVALYNAASQVYLLNRPATLSGAPLAAPKDWSDKEAVETYGKALQERMQSAMQYGAAEAKALWSHLFNESFTQVSK